MSEGKMSAGRALDYIDARQMAKAMARWRVAGDLPDEQLQEDSVACRFLNRRIAELTEEYVPYAIAAIKALGAEPMDISALQREADGMREALERIAAGDGVYGAQAHEYKQIARAALNVSPQEAASGDNKP